MRIHGVWGGLVVMALGCSSTTGSNNNTPGAPGVLSKTSTGYRINISAFKVPPGQEVQRCVVVEGLPETVLIQNSRVQQKQGGHHLALFTNHSARPGNAYDCTAASTMATARFISPGQFDGTAENLAYRIPAGAAFIVQSHYINTTQSEMSVEDVFEADVLPAAAPTPKLVDFMALVDTDFQIPAGQGLVLQRTCNINKDMKLLRHFGHMHELGRHYSLELLAPSAQPRLLDSYDWEIDYRDNAPLNDFTVANALVVHAGEQLRITCDWSNVKDHDVSFPEEMCVTFMHYLVDENWPGGFLTCTDSAPELVDEN